MKVKFFRQGNAVALRDPYTGEKNRLMFYTNAKDVPAELDQWLEANPRSQNLTSDVSAQIRMSLLEETDNPRFYLRNRGIKLSVATIEKCNTNDDEIVLSLEDPELHGIIDGGHTYRVIRHNARSAKEDQYVLFDVMIGQPDIVDIAQALNTSAQVDARTIANHWGYFNTLDKLIDGLPFANRVEKYQNYRLERDIAHPIDVRILIGIINLMNIELYPTISSARKLPTPNVYAVAETNLARYVALAEERRDQLYLPMRSIIEDIARLYDIIETDTADFLKRFAQTRGGDKLLKMKDGEFKGHARSLFSDQPLETPKIAGIVWPIYSAMRYLVARDLAGNYTWKTDPMRFWESNKKEIFRRVLRLMELHPRAITQFGIDKDVWRDLFEGVAFLYNEMATEAAYR